MASALSIAFLSGESCQGEAACLSLYQSPQWSRCQCLQCWQGLLRSSVVKAAGAAKEPATGSRGHSQHELQAGSPCPSSWFLTVSRCLSNAGLWVRETKVCPSCSAPKAGEAGCSPHSMSSREKASFRPRSSLLALSSAGLGDAVMQAKGNSLSYSCFVVIPKSFAPLCCRNVVSGFLSYFGVCICLIVVLCVGTDAEVSYSTTLVMPASWIYFCLLAILWPKAAVGLQKWKY